MATHSDLTTAFSSLLTVAIHTILYERSLYPRASFLTTQFHNYPVHQSRHPLVCQWISDAVSAIEKLVVEGAVKHVVLLIFDAQHIPMERFVFDVARFPIVSTREREAILQRGASEEGADDSEDTDWEEEHKEKLSVEVSESIRGVMARLSLVSSRLKPLPPNCSYTVAMELKEDADAPIGHPQPWIPAEPPTKVSNKLDDSKGQKRTKRTADTKTVPIRSVEAGELLLEVWVEEASTKTVKRSQPTDTDTTNTDAPSKT